jgi:WXG100 family type VII secretion target
MAQPGEIYIEYQAAEEATQQLLNTNNQLIAVIDQLHSGVSQWESSARGMSASQFEETFAQWKGKAQNVGNAIAQHARTLSNISDSYQTTDSSNANRMANTPTS